MDIKADHKSQVLIGEDFLQKSAGHNLFHWQRMFHTQAAVNQQAHGKRQIIFGGEIFIGLGLPFFQQIKMVLGKDSGSRPHAYLYCEQHASLTRVLAEDRYFSLLLSGTCSYPEPVFPVLFAQMVGASAWQAGRKEQMRQQKRRNKSHKGLWAQPF